MLRDPSVKYRPFPQVDLPDRQWPSRTITKPPRWLSTDMRDGNQALIDPMDGEKKQRFFDLFDERQVASDLFAVVEDTRIDTLVRREYGGIRKAWSRTQENELEKRRLATQDWPTVDDYAEAKGDVVWALLREGDRWSCFGWDPGRSDA